MPASSESSIYLFDRFLTEETEQLHASAICHEDVFGYRVKTYRYRNLIECEAFPIWKTNSSSSRAARKKESRQAQKNLNHKNTKKQIARYANSNFTESDLWVTLTYNNGNYPKTLEEARRDIQNYIRRIKRHRCKQGLPALRYIYVTEFEDVDGEPVRAHHHIIISGDMGMDYLQKEWRHGGRNNFRPICPDDMGITGLAHYLGKCKSKHKVWGHSRNLKMPKPTIADKKLTKRQAMKIAADYANVRSFFAKAYPGYVLKDAEKSLEIKYSDFVSGVYIYAMLCKSGRSTG